MGEFISPFLLEVIRRRCHAEGSATHPVAGTAPGSRNGILRELLRRVWETSLGNPKRSLAEVEFETKPPFDGRRAREAAALAGAGD
jgi:hypothetical protein